MNKALPTLMHMKPKTSKFSEDGENQVKLRSISDNSPYKNKKEIILKDEQKEEKVEEAGF